MEKLISMTDFITWVDEKRNKNGGHYDIIVRYKNFIKQHLTIEMFVPCKQQNEFTNFQPMKEPSKEMWNKFINSELGSFDDLYTYCFEYQQAKERCLFDGFKLDGKYLWLKDSLFMISDNYNKSFKNYGNIESLLYKYLTNNLQLTPTALKQIGL